MEYYLCRAMEVSRLSEENKIKLQVVERNVKRALYPHEIQNIFKICSLKEQYGIPENDISQSVHTQRLRSDFRSIGKNPIYGDLNIDDLEAVHKFDLNDFMIDFRYQGGRENKKFTDGI